MNLYGEESFGPVVAVIRARDEAHAIELANDSDYGLSAAMFTRDTPAGIERCASDPFRHLPCQRTNRS